MKQPLNSFFGFALIALLITAAVVYVGYTYARPCPSDAAAEEGFQGAAAAAAPGSATVGTPQKGGMNGMVGPVGVAAGGAEGAEPVRTEGFFAGPARGAGEPDCLRTSKEAAELYEMLASKCTGAVEEGPDDLRELKVLLGKVACFKRDLMGTAQQVEATRYQPFSTSHDMEPVAETTARCFAKTIPQRDLALSLDKWGSRGTFLIKRLCTAVNLTASQEKEALELFGALMADITDVANGVCCNAGTPVIAGMPAPRMVGGYEPPGDYEAREYKGYY